jgi:hypothetical protein
LLASGLALRCRARCPERMRPRVSCVIPAAGVRPRDCEESSEPISFDHPDKEGFRHPERVKARREML